MLFHLVGFLINEGENVLTLIKLSTSNGKEAFRRALKQAIQEKTIPDSVGEGLSAIQVNASVLEFLSTLEYGTDSRQIRSLLLLFNIASIVANTKSIIRFRFDYFKKESWDIEHIRSVESGRPTANVDKRAWLETVRGYFTETGEKKSLRNKAQEMLTSGSYTTGDDFDILYNTIIKHFNENEFIETENGIGNLALLDSGSNRGYRNAVFPIKRRRLLQYDQEGTFIPLCTRNAFLKAYSTRLENMFFWGAEDQDDYLKAMAETLAGFFMEIGS